MTPSPQQRAAIEHDGPVVIVAGPGAGKTSTLVKRIERIVKASDRHRFVGATFTREGATTMLARLKKTLTPKALARVQVGTFHKLIFDHLKAHGRLPRLASPAQSRAALERVRHLVPAEEQDGLQLVFEAIKCSMTPHPRSGERWFKEYQRQLSRHGLIDFYDVMRDAVLAMEAGTLPLIECTHMGVDEAQDSDEVQQRFALAHVRAGVQPTMIGDDDQTIYRWRRALGYEGMVAFARAAGAKLLPLTENYRSHREIVQAAGRLIAHNTARVAKTFLPKVGAGGHITLHPQESTPAAAADIAEWLAARAHPMPRYAGSRMPLAFPEGSFAVLARNNVDLDYVQRELAARGVRFSRPGGSILDKPVVRCFLGLLRAAETPATDAIDAALHGLRMSEDGIDTVITAAEDLGRGSSATDWLDLAAGYMAPEDASIAHALAPAMAAWTRSLAAGHVRLALMAAHGWMSKHYPFASGRGKAAQDAAARDAYRLAAAVESVSRFKGTIAARLAAMTQAEKPRALEHAVELMTVHGSKGGEWDTVILFRADAGVLPSKNATDIEDERRLFYVAITRPRKELQIHYSDKTPSPFVAEMALPTDQRQPEARSAGTLARQEQQGRFAA